MDTNSFHMPLEQMTVTLHDVDFILSILAYGDAICTEFSGEENVQMLSRDFGRVVGSTSVLCVGFHGQTFQLLVILVSLAQRLDQQPISFPFLGLNVHRQWQFERSGL